MSLRGWVARAVIAVLVLSGVVAALFSSGRASAHDCSLCLHFVTTFDPDGTAGPKAAKTRLQDGVLVDVPYALDVNGNNPPVPLGALPAVPGYEVSVTVLATDAEQPTITIKKLAGAPSTMPLRIEAVTGSVSRPAGEKTSFGYDTLDSTAPLNFTAKLDIRDTDGNPNTDRARIGLNIGGPGQRLTIVNEVFTGDPAGTRTDRHIRRATFIRGGTPKTSIPTKGRLTVLTSPKTQRVAFRTDRRSELGFELKEPNNDATTGTISNLPFFTRVDLADTDVDADGQDDTKVDYRATNRVRHAEIDVQNGDTGVFTNIGVDALPKEAHVTYSTPGEDTHLTYAASERAGGAQVHVGGGDTDFKAEAENLPTNITDLSYVTKPDGGTVTYHADARADFVQVEETVENQHLVANADTIPENIDELTYGTPAEHMDLHYVADATTPHVGISLDTILFETPDNPEHTRTVTGSIDDLAREVDFHLATPASADTTVDYTADDPITRLAMTADDELPLFSRAKALSLTLEGLPTGFHGDFGNDYTLIDPLGGHLGMAELRAQDHRWDESDPDPLGDAHQDGLFVDDDPEGTEVYQLLARIHDLTKLETDTNPNLDALLDTDSNPARSFDINLHYPTEDFNSTQRLSGSIDTLRPGTHVFVGSENADTDLVSYDDASAGTGPAITLDGSGLEWLPAGSNGAQAREVHLDLIGMPRHLAYRHATDASLPAEERNGLPMDVETSGGTLGEADLQITSGADEGLPSGHDGFYMRDLADKFVIAARGRHFHSLHVDRPTDQHFELDVDAPDSNPGDIDVRKGVVDEVWAPFHRPGVEAIQGSIASVPANVSLDMRSSDDPAKKELTYTADDTAASFNLESSSVHSGGDVEIGYMNDFLNDHMPYVFSPSAFDTSQTLSLNPMPKFFHVCQIATGNDCTSDVFTPGMFDEFNPNSSANGGSIRFQADPRAHFSFHDSSPKVTDFWYNRINYEPPNGCQAGEQPGPNTPSGSDPLDCEGKDVAPGRATSDIELDLNNLAIQTHQEDAGFVGEVVGYPDQGYIALDTGWESDYVSCTDALVETGWDPGDASAFCANPAAANIHGHHAPPPEQRVSGEIEKAGGFAESVDDLSNANDFDRLPTPIVDGVDLEFGDKLGLDHRIFEYDPDELIFAKTYNGHSYCQDDTHLEGNGNDFTGLFCEGDEAILLP